MNKPLLPIALLTLALAGGIAAVAQPPAQPAAKPQAKPEKAEEGDEVEIKLADAPAAVRAAATKLAPEKDIKKMTKEEDEGITAFEVEYTAGGADCSAVLSAAGEVMVLEKVIKQDALPATALAALKKKFPEATFKTVESVQRFYYETVVVIGGKNYEVEVDAAGEVKGGPKKPQGEKGEKGGKDEDDKD